LVTDVQERTHHTAPEIENEPKGGQGVLKGLARAAYSHRHDFHFLRRIQWEIIESYLRPGEGEYILDMACGDGYYSRKMAARGARVAAMDLDPQRISNALKYHKVPGVEYRLADAEALPYSDGTFDKVVSVCALEHFHHPERAIAEAHRVLKPGGELVLHVDSFTYRGISPALKEHHRVHYYVQNFFTAASLGKILAECGFKVRKHRFSFNSALTSRFYEWGEMRGFTGLPFLLMFPIAYPLIKLSDRFSGNRREGYDYYVSATRAG
jgi:ubiquinone/menaquinone biosynthesis C-methylase UbiE